MNPTYTYYINKNILFMVNEVDYMVHCLTIADMDKEIFVVSYSGGHISRTTFCRMMWGSAEETECSRVARDTFIIVLINLIVNEGYTVIH